MKQRRLMTVVSLAVLLGLGAAGIGPAHAEETPVEPATIEDGVSVGDPQTAEVDALAEALTTQQDVVVESRTTEHELLVAQPDGNLRLELSTEPARVNADGTWIPIDLTLGLAASGFVEPAAVTVPVRFSAGGNGTLAEIQSGSGEWLSEQWPLGALPVPALEANTATYAEVLPGVDLRLAATATGMTEVLIIESAEAAVQPELEALTLAVNGLSLSQDVDGSITTGEAMDLRSSTPQWWDSSEDGASADGPGGAGISQSVDVTVEDDSLELSVSSIEEESEVIYPLFVDPDWNGGNVHAWFVDDAYPSQSYLDGGAYTDGVQKVGFVNAGWSSDNRNHRARSLWLMNTSGVKGKHILNAVFSVQALYSSSCTATPVEFWWTAGAVGGTWGSDSWISKMDTKNWAGGRSGCADQPYLGFSATYGVRQAAQTNADSLTMGMRASNENDQLSWKKFAVNGSLTITYNSVPNPPSNLRFTSPTRACGTLAVPAVVNGSRAFTMAATASDPDGGNMHTRFYVTDSSWFPTNRLPSSLAPLGYLQTATAAGGTQSAVIPANTLTEGMYVWSATSNDGTDTSGSSSLCYFQVDNTGPSLPTIVSRAAGPYTVGQPTVVQFGSVPAEKVKLFVFWWAYGASTTPPAVPVTVGSTLPACDSGSGPVRYVCPGTDGKSPVVTIAPVSTSAVLWVATYDGAGNISKAGTVNAIAVPYSGADSAGPDLANVSYESGHGWSTLDASSPLGASLPDRNINAGSTLTSADSLGITAATVRTSLSAPIEGDLPQPVVDTSGYVRLARYANASSGVSLETVVGTAPSGFALVEYLGWIEPAGQSGSAVPAGVTPVFRCLQSGGEDFLTSDPACEGIGSGPSLLGYMWSTQPVGFAGQLVYRCTSGDKIATTSWDQCKAPEFNLGYFATADPALSAPPMSTERTAVDTVGSYTVSAWLRPKTTTSISAALSQSGDSNSSFMLGVVLGQWSLTARGQDGETDYVRASGGTATTGAWQFVTGIVDTANQQIRLYVGDSEAPIAVTWREPVANDVAGSGELLLGAALTSDQISYRWRGQIVSPSVFPGVANKVQRQNLYFQGNPN